ncbi:holo-(acyl-carrier-protein) synthase [Desulfarculales bacterium]
MIRGLGLDLARVSRVEEAWRRFGQRFLERCFTSAEIAACLERPRPSQALATRFAAKEAFAKATGLGLRGIAWTDIEVQNDDLGKPGLVLNGRTRAWMAAQGIAVCHLSLSDDGDYAAAVVVLEA